MAEKSAAPSLGFGHFQARTLFDKADGPQNGQPGVALAASGAAVSGNKVKAERGHFIGLAPFGHRQRRGPQNQAYENAAANGRAATAPKAANAARHFPAAPPGLQQGFRQIKAAARIFISGQ